MIAPVTPSNLVTAAMCALNEAPGVDIRSEAAVRVACVVGHTMLRKVYRSSMQQFLMADDTAEAAAVNYHVERMGAWINDLANALEDALNDLDGAAWPTQNASPTPKPSTAQPEPGALSWL